jgi:hypothetical protein
VDHDDEIRALGEEAKGLRPGPDGPLPREIPLLPPQVVRGELVARVEEERLLERDARPLGDPPDLLAVLRRQEPREPLAARPKDEIPRPLVGGQRPVEIPSDAVLERLAERAPLGAGRPRQADDGDPKDVLDPGPQRLGPPAPPTKDPLAGRDNRDRDDAEGH